MNLQGVVSGSGGPYFEANWRRQGLWGSEQFRLFRNARNRCVEECQAGADIAYVNHMATDEPVYSQGATA